MTQLASARTLLLLAAAAAAAPTSRASTFFVLTRQWPFSYCSPQSEAGGAKDNAKKCIHPPRSERFTVHGLWRDWDDGDYDDYCDGKPAPPLDVGSLAPVRAQLDEEWPSYYGPNSDFWAHEWGRHGTCAEDLFPEQVDFFNATLQLHEYYNLEDALSDESINPGSSSTYSADDVAAAIRDKYGAQPLVHCKFGNKLTEIWMCFNEDLELEDCERACPRRSCRILQDCPRDMLYPGLDASSSAVDQE